MFGSKWRDSAWSVAMAGDDVILEFENSTKVKLTPELARFIAARLVAVADLLDPPAPKESVNGSNPA